MQVPRFTFHHVDFEVFQNNLWKAFSFSTELPGRFVKGANCSYMCGSLFEQSDSATLISFSVFMPFRFEALPFSCDVFSGPWVVWRCLA